MLTEDFLIGKLGSLLKEIRSLYKSYYRGEPPYNLQHCLDMLMYADDQAIRDKAGALFREYHYTDGQYDAVRQIEKGKPLQ